MAENTSNSYMGDALATDDDSLRPLDPLEVLKSRAPSEFTGSLLLSQPPSLPLSVEDQKAMASKINAIFDIEERPRDEDVEMNDGEEDSEPVIDLEEQRRRTEALKSILSTLAQLWWSDSEEMDIVTEKLADGSRDSRWRIPLGDSGVLTFFLEILSAHVLRPNVKIHVLRLVGNSCADTDENRARVVASNYLPSIISNLKDVPLLPFAIPVLYNICIDYEPAQQEASAASLTRELIELISSPRFNNARAFFGYICKILDFMVTQPSDLELAPDDTARVLLNLAADREVPVDMEDFIAAVNTAVAYLQHEKFQKALMAPGAMDRTLAVLVDSYTRFDSHPSIGSDHEDAKALQQMRSNFNQVLSDVSALPEFRETCPVTSPLTSSLRRWLLSPQTQLQVCACIMLGNLARSDAACEEFVHVSRVHLPLISILTDASDSQLLHAALGFLKNLALPTKNKDVLGESGIFDVLPRLWNLDTLQQIQFASISLARQLTISCFENVRKVCKRLSEDMDSPAYARTKLSLLIALFERTDVEPIKMEIARLITSICRVYNTSGAINRSPEELQRIRISFLDRHPDVGRPLGFMVSQTKWPVVRSEGWFVFALMARYPEGAKCISDLLHDVAVFRPLVEMLTGKDLVEYVPNNATGASPLTSNSASSPTSSSSNSNNISSVGLTSSSTSSSLSPSSNSSVASASNLLTLSPESPQPHAQAAEMARIDRENALVLVSEMLKNRGPEMAVMRRTLFEDLLKGGSEIVLSYREASKGWGDTPVGKDKRVRAGLNVQEAAQQSLLEFS